MKQLKILKSKTGQSTAINYDLDVGFDKLAERGAIDACVVSTEDGFSPLGVARSFFATDLGIPESEIKRMADWNHFESEQVALVAFASRRESSRLRGIILAPGETSCCYTQFATPIHGRPHRDFYYNVSYEAIAYACREWGARNLAISHLSASHNFHEDIATCNAEALAHYCSGHLDAPPDSFIFCGCCISESHLNGIDRLNAEGARTSHRPIRTTLEDIGGARLIHLSWASEG